MRKRQKLPKPRKGAWFIKLRGSYLPATWQGWLTYIPFVAYLLWSMLFAFDNFQGIGLIVAVVFPQWIAATVALTWVAQQKS